MVNFGSEVTYRDEATGRAYTVKLVMPHDADVRARRVSVLTPVGTALIGRAEGAVIDCEFPVGKCGSCGCCASSKPRRRSETPRSWRTGLATGLEAAFVAGDAPA